MYNSLKNDIEDKKILEEEINTLEGRIKYKIQSQLGLHATTYSELKIECPNVEDKFARVFSQIEKLDKNRIVLQGELDIIENEIKKVDELLSSMDDVSKKIFRCRYIWGLSVSKTAKRLNYSEDYVKELTKKLFKK